MKGTLLLLALLVTGELGIQTTEACIPYLETFYVTAFGNKKTLNKLISKFSPTDKEREALEKIQECFNEGGLKAKVLDAKVLEAILFSPQCIEYYTKDIIDKIKNFLSKLTSM
ncbi:androgen-binding protein homolog [Peromyscus eremicus]|uniref:androgen-binding protein homolog n=1 Tax=Peromyscus eremicus TaxID=42410 RepID=UPI0027DD5667|nr:androgen-binding protein homolog [Peromyscus eremicus]